MNSDFLRPILDSMPTSIKLYGGWIVAGIILIVWVLKFLSSTVPQVEIVKSKLIMPAAKRWRHKKLVRAAIKSDIRGHVNLAVRKLQNELPAGWIQEMDIDWVEKETKDDFLDDNNVVIRMKPLENQDHNFVTAVYYFLRKAFFPKTKRVIPDTHREASTLYVCRRVIHTQKENLLSLFEDCILEPAVQKKPDILDCLDRYHNIDQRGFFTGTFLREIHEIGSQVKFNQMRSKMDSEVAEILEHIEGFIKNLGSDKKIPPGGWYRFGPVTSYSFLLIAHPMKTAGGVGPYINRAKESLNQGANRLYIFGNAEEKWFTESVIGHIRRYAPGWKLAERFDLYRDYRGDEGGIGALFVANRE